MYHPPAALPWPIPRSSSRTSPIFDLSSVCSWLDSSATFFFVVSMSSSCAPNLLRCTCSSSILLCNVCCACSRALYSAELQSYERRSLINACSARACVPAHAHLQLALPQMAVAVQDLRRAHSGVSNPRRTRRPGETETEGEKEARVWLRGAAPPPAGAASIACVGPTAGWRTPQCICGPACLPDRRVGGGGLAPSAAV